MLTLLLVTCYVCILTGDLVGDLYLCV